MTTNGDHLPEFRDPWRAVLAYGLLAAVLIVVVGLPVLAAWRDEPITTAHLGLFDLFVVQALLVGMLAVWFLLQQRDDLRTFLALPRGNWRPRVLAGLQLGLTGWLLTVTAMLALALVTDAEGTETPKDFLEFVTWLATRPLPLRLLLIASAMTVEEAFFRAFLQPRVGLVVATGAFVLGHVGYGSPSMGAGVLVIGSILALAFRRRPDLAVCALAHGVFDSIQLLVILPMVASRV
jgi:membrane protease YdiL (CAAX protease family)